MNYNIKITRHPSFHIQILRLNKGVSWTKYLIFADHQTQSGYDNHLSKCYRSLVSKYHFDYRDRSLTLVHWCLPLWLKLVIILVVLITLFPGGAVGGVKRDDKFISLSSLFKDYSESEPMVSLGNSIELLVLMKRLGWRLLYLCFSSVKSHKRLAQGYNFFKYLLIMRKHHGPVFVVNYLKSGQLAIQKQIAKDKISSMRDLNPHFPFPRLSSSRLPRYIPVSDRKLISAGSPSVIRWWLSLFSVYRIINLEVKEPVFTTIVGPLTVPVEQVEGVAEDLDTCVSRLRSIFLPPTLPRAELKFLETASPSSKVSWMGLVTDVMLLGSRKDSDKDLTGHIRYFLSRANNYKTLELFDYIESLLKGKGHLIPSYGESLLGNRLGWGNSVEFPSLGKLSIKKEPAGKLRVFAMVDVWTQTCLRPFHLWLFQVLKRLPNDGTFDQYGAVKRCFTKSKVAHMSFGYDLSAATDRLPMALQVSVVKALFGREFAVRWKELLVDRTYLYKGFNPNDKGWGSQEYVPGLFTYTVGQPMGALSSWAMLALTHHLIVQLAAQRVYGIKQYRKWFENYELLGDDIVIFDSKVAAAYLDIMSTVGAPINLSKSVVAKTDAFEFAKVTGLNGRDVSALSWRMLISQNTLLGRVNIAYSLMKKGIFYDSPVKKLRMLFSKSRWTLGALNYPYMALLSMLSKNGLFPFKDLVTLIMMSGVDRRLNYNKLVKKLPIPYMELALASLIREKPFERPFEGAKAMLAYWGNHMFIKDYLGKRVKAFWLDDPWEAKVNLWSYSVGDMICDTKILDPAHRKGLAMRLADLFYLSHRPLERRLEEYFKIPVNMHRHRTNLVHWQDLFTGRLANPHIHKPGVSAQLTQSIPELIDTVQLIDGVYSDWQLPNRAIEKLDCPEKSREKKDTPLKWVSFVLLAVRYGVPGFWW